MITLDQCKSLLRLGNTYDDLITEVIPLVEDLIIHYTNNTFVMQDTIVSGTTDGTTLVSGLTNNTIVTPCKVYVEGLGTYNVITGTTTSITLDATIEADSVTLGRVRYPRSLTLVAAQLVKYHIQKRTLGLKSESVDDYSATYADDIPKWLKSDLNRYAKYKEVI